MDPMASSGVDPPATSNVHDIVRALEDRIAQLENNRTPKKPRHTQPDPERYDHSKPEYFPQFRSLLQAKLVIDSAAIGNAFERLWYAFGRLSGDAASRIHPWIDTYGKNPSLVSDTTIESFFKEMDFAFADPLLQEKAITRLNTLRQGKQDFRIFLGIFEQTLLEAGGHAWDDSIKRGFIDAAINQDLRKGMVGVTKERAFTPYCRQLQEVWDQLEQISKIDKSRSSQKGRTIQPAPTPNTLSTAGESMDWTPAGAELNTLKQRAKWVSAEEIVKRKGEGRCLRCGASGHMIKNCPYRPAIKPATRVAALQTCGPELENEVTTGKLENE